MKNRRFKSGAVVTKPPENGTAVDTDQARQIIKQQKEANAKACGDAIEAALKKYGCRLIYDPGFYLAEDRSLKCNITAQVVCVEA